MIEEEEKKFPLIEAEWKPKKETKTRALLYYLLIFIILIILSIFVPDIPKLGGT